MSLSFIRALKAETLRIREIFADANAPSMSIHIRCGGQVDHGDIAITFDIGESQYGDSVKGNSIEQCIEEYFRRKGWKRDHDAILISYVAPEVD